MIRSESSLWSPSRGQLNSPPGCRTWLRPSTTSSSREALRITHTVSNERQMGPHGSTPSDRLTTSAASRNHTRLQLLLQLGCDVQTAQTHACGHVSYPRSQQCSAQPAYSPQAQVLSRTPPAQRQVQYAPIPIGAYFAHQERGIWRTRNVHAASP